MKLFTASQAWTPGTQGTFNSLLSPSGPKTNHCSGTPRLIHLPPQHTRYRYNESKCYHHKCHKTAGIHSCDSYLQLYDMDFKWWIEFEDIQRKFLFWPGEPWIVFWALISLWFVLATGRLCLLYQSKLHAILKERSFFTTSFEFEVMCKCRKPTTSNRMTLLIYIFVHTTESWFGGRPMKVNQVLIWRKANES